MYIKLDKKKIYKIKYNRCNCDNCKLNADCYEEKKDNNCKKCNIKCNGKFCNNCRKN